MIKAIIFDFFGVVFIRSGWDWKINDELMALSDKLREEFKIGLISNSSQTSARIILDEQGMTGRFDEIIVSDEVGFNKPQPEIFELAAKKLGVKPAETVFIDDSAYNVNGAATAGMHSVVYKDLVSLKDELSKLDI